MDKKYDGELLLNEDDHPILIEEECAELTPILKDFVETWAENADQPEEVGYLQSYKNICPRSQRQRSSQFRTRSLRPLRLP